jgi:hypothetical protein
VLRDNLCRQLFHTKLELARCGLVLFKFGNAGEDSGADRFGRALHDKQYSLKHGRDAYYGQAVRNGTY